MKSIPKSIGNVMSKVKSSNVNHGLQIQIFKYAEENHFDDIGIIEIDEIPYFIASDVCKALDISNTTTALKSLDEDEKLPYIVERAGQKRKVNLVNESGLYELVFKSRKPSAKKFRKWITKEVIPSIRKTGSFGVQKVTPTFVRRFNLNWNRTDKGYFSVISELFVRLYGRFEQVGYIIPNTALDGKELRPDCSVGLLFSKYLKNKFPNQSGKHKMYSHIFTNGFTVDARQYPNELLHIFIDFVDNVWIPQRATKYFEKRDLKALDYLPKLIS